MTALVPEPGENLLDAVKKFAHPLHLALIDTASGEIPPEALYRLMKRFFPEAAFVFFGPDRDRAAEMDSGVPWMETPSAGALLACRSLDSLPDAPPEGPAGTH